MPSPTSSSSFRNPPHLLGLIPDYNSYNEMNLRDAQYETAAVLDNYFYQDNVAPFLCVRIMQRFMISVPSPRYVKECVTAFITGSYISGSRDFGSGEYGSLGAMIASIVLDKEATEGAVTMDPSYGSLKEPILKLTNLMRSMDYQTSIPSNLAGDPMQSTYNTKLWKIDEKIGHGPYEFRTVFSYFLPEYIPDSGPNLLAKLPSPESMVATMPNIVNLLNGMFSMIKYGLSDCNSGFSLYPGYSSCYDNGKFERSFGHLFYEPEGTTLFAKAKDMSLLLTADRLDNTALQQIVEACDLPDANLTLASFGWSPTLPLNVCQGDCDRDSDCQSGYKCFQRDDYTPVPGCLGQGVSGYDYCYFDSSDGAAKTRCMQQLIVSTGEFHSNNLATLSGEDRATEVAPPPSNETYKAIVYFYLGGGLGKQNSCHGTCEL